VTRDAAIDPLAPWRARALTFGPGPDPTRPLCAEADGVVLTIRLGDFPAEPLYLVELDGEEVGGLDDWPEAWRRPTRRGLLATLLGRRG